MARICLGREALEGTHSFPLPAHVLLFGLYSVEVLVPLLPVRRTVRYLEGIKACLEYGNLLEGCSLILWVSSSVLSEGLWQNIPIVPVT